MQLLQALLHWCWNSLTCNIYAPSIHVTATRTYPGSLRQFWRTVRCNIFHFKAGQRRKKQCSKEVTLRGRQSVDGGEPAGDTEVAVVPCQVTATWHPFWLTTGRGCLWLSHRRNGWKGLWCWSCSAWFQNENKELLAGQHMTAIGNH